MTPREFIERFTAAVTSEQMDTEVIFIADISTDPEECLTLGCKDVEVAPDGVVYVTLQEY